MRQELDFCTSCDFPTSRSQCVCVFSVFLIIRTMMLDGTIKQFGKLLHNSALML
jgi:hypothetical protein